MKKAIKIGKIAVNAIEFGSQGNAVLGIRDSGKSYTATWFAERLFEAGIPFVAFDPIGIWRFLKVPGKGRGYPVVVAGGKEPDLTLTPQTAPAIVEAAMQNGISLVIDLFSIDLSKADWRRIVKDSVRLLLHKNQPHGLRHIFIEEAAEFIPQKPIDWDVYAEIEKLARMGGNSRLGYTLINQRSQEVSKAILELCENIFLHRQRGKNALENLDKWLAIVGATEQKEIIKSLPDMPQGECWAWIGGDNPQPPVRVKIPHKNSEHPDRRIMHGDALVSGKAVDVGKFVATLRDALPQIAEDGKANDPKQLRAEIAKLKRDLANVEKAARTGRIDPKALEEVEQRGYQRGASEALRWAGSQFTLGIDDEIQQASDRIASLRAWRDRFKSGGWAAEFEGAGVPIPTRPIPRATPARPPVTTPAAAHANGSLSGSQRRVIEALAFWSSLGFPAPTRVQVGVVAGYSPRSGGFANLLGQLRTLGYIDYPTTGAVSLTPQGEEVAPVPDDRSVRERALSILSGSQQRILIALLDSGGSLSREQLAELTEYSATSGGYANLLGSLRSLGIISYPSKGTVEAEAWLTQ